MAVPKESQRQDKRRYSSPVREQLAADTRSRIAAAAKELFAKHGFSGTTVASIAERAGVATPTVYATFGSKGAIVRALLAQMEGDAGNAEWVGRIRRETDPHAKLEAFAMWTTALFSSSKLLIEAAAGAASDPAMAALRDEGNKRRREGLRGIVGALHKGGALAAGLSEERALDRAWMLTGIELYLSATDGCGWSDEDYQVWLAALLQQQLLA